MEESNDPFVFIAGSVMPEAIDAAISLTANTNFPMIYCHSEYHHLFLDKNWDFHLRAELELKNPPHPCLLEDGFVIKSIDSLDFFKKCFWFKETSERYGSPEKFLRFGKGYALYKGEHIISECYTDYVGGGYTEIGIVTHPDYRGQGFGSQVASYLISKCLDQNYTPIWSCQVNNRASLKVAIKIGFSISRYYVQMVRDVGNTFGPALIKWIKDNPDWE